MDWKLFAVTFVSIFAAEIGDKTQLATMAFSAESKRPWLVFAAASLALVAAAGAGAALGGALPRWIPEAWIRRGAAALFVAVGIWMFLSAQ
ncbi:MAG TPA: TMEM165/GDT1 family protein [Planctomycetota bacterium]|nr:TMEM165/GDT1 family protein [Planctomycetota bacterium]